MSKRALLIGSSFSAAPIFFSLKRRGIEVAVCGNLPSDPCHQYADVSHFLDYSKREDLLNLASREKFDYLVPTCNDYSYLSGAWVAKQLGYLGFDSYETTRMLHTKNAFRAVTEAHGLPVPRSVRQTVGAKFTTGDLKFPLLMKPDDSFSGRGVTKIHSPEELDSAVQTALNSSRSGEVVLEEFVDGQLHSHSAFIAGGKVAIDFFVDEFCTIYPYQVNCSNYPSRLSDNIKVGVREAMNKLIGILGLVDGLLHTQFICDGRRFWIIECMRRCPGDLYGGLIESSLAVNYTDLFVRPFVGEPIPPGMTTRDSKPIGRHTISRPHASCVYSFSHEIANAKVRIVPLKNSGERLDGAPYDKLGILFVEFQSQQDMLDMTPHFEQLVSIQTLEDFYCECRPFDLSR